ncbi:Hypothetical protein SMAX5B_016798 [Scophthalmus maximus]|uniref:Uncharacterized protein n=1 Tax=Scophthalmus maximus TaxID=52904 RepID=A0A2U9CG45_SCOMX|nr:Hypothetical protein SMAX5B_016798 [Scophthalmus maximus]
MDAWPIKAIEVRPITVGVGRLGQKYQGRFLVPVQPCIAPTHICAQKTLATNTGDRHVTAVVDLGGACDRLLIQSEERDTETFL